MNPVILTKETFNPYLMIIDDISNTYVYVVISKTNPLTDISVLSLSHDITDILLNVDESKYKIMKLPVIQHQEV